MSGLPYYELFFAIASYVAILCFAHFARQKPPLFGAASTRSRLALGLFILGSAAAVFLGATGLARIQGLEKGFVFYGGLLGFLVFLLVFVRFKLRDFIEVLNRLAPGLALAHAAGRIGCFIEGCCYGTHCDLPWAVHNAAAKDLVHPVQLYESAALAVLGLFLWKNESRRLGGLVSNETSGLYLASYAAIRFILEFFRGDLTRGSFGPLSTSQWIAIPLFALGLGLILDRVRRRILRSLRSNAR